MELQICNVESKMDDWNIEMIDVKKKIDLQKIWMFLLYLDDELKHIGN